MQLSTFTYAVNAGDEASGVSKELLIAAAVGFAAGAAWSALCVTLGWPLVGWAGIALGFFVGGAMVALLRSAVSPIAGVVAAVLAMLTLAVAAGFESRSDSQSAIAAAQSDASYITAIAEQILWERATPKLDEQGQPLPSAAPLDPQITAGIAPEAIPANVNHEAAARWAAMSDAERQSIRDQRQRWMTASLGPDMNQLERPATGWPPAAVVTLAGVVAMLSAAWPAVAARYCGMLDR